MPNLIGKLSSLHRVRLARTYDISRLPGRFFPMGISCCSFKGNSHRSRNDGLVVVAFREAARRSFQGGASLHVSQLGSLQSTNNVKKRTISALINMSHEDSDLIDFSDEGTPAKKPVPERKNTAPTESLRPPLQPPIRKYSNPLFSTLHYFTDPLSYTLSSVARRLSEDDAPTPVARALSANYNEPMLDPNTGIFQPPKRRLSPFQPPPLTPLELYGYHSSTNTDRKLLSRALAEEIRLLFPARLQLCDHWDLIYSLDQDGSTLSTLYSRCDKHRGKRGGFVLVVRDSGGGLFGAYLSDPPKPQAHYFGSGECFLWRSQILASLPNLLGHPDLLDLPPPPSEDTTHATRMTTVGIKKSNSSVSLGVPKLNGTNGQKSGVSTPDRIRFKAFPYTGENDFNIFCQPEYLSVGGGDGHYGLWVDGSLNKGVSQTCQTYGNEPLSDEGPKFNVLGVEVWYVGS